MLSGPQGSDSNTTLSSLSLARRTNAKADLTFPQTLFVLSECELPLQLESSPYLFLLLFSP